MILIDPAVWPAHGTVFSHLVSDTSLAELHEFARAAEIPERAFDHDHYDVPLSRYDDLVARGAVPVSAKELLQRLVASGLRMRTTERTPKRVVALQRLAESWQELLPGHDAIGAELVERWTESHRHYHDVRHLLQVLTALVQVGPPTTPDDDRTLRLAAWFHDAVYEGTEHDEENSAQLAERMLGRFLPTRQVDEVARLVRLTRTHDPDEHDQAGAQLVDADLSVLGQRPGRYDVYVRDVRADYAHVPDELWRFGRLRVLDHLLGLTPLFRTARGRELWAERATENLTAERARWAG
ncbi:DUF4031 domain-containing protein [Propionibacteriaceae bacterium Y1923]|uniref:DUF4031 domain-containing protein n=1 Tax=Aestuariimicrobium sp. Y1814 TaxID=3418742 RepID=UPI003C1F1325